MTNYEWLVTKGKLKDFVHSLHFNYAITSVEKYDIPIEKDNDKLDAEKLMDITADWLQKEHREPLEPCPFCGGDAEIINVQPYVFYVRCKICKGCSNEFGTPYVAIEKWNRRVEK